MQMSRHKAIAYPKRSSIHLGAVKPSYNRSAYPHVDARTEIANLLEGVRKPGDGAGGSCVRASSVGDAEVVYDGELKDVHLRVLVLSELADGLDETNLQLFARPVLGL